MSYTHPVALGLDVAPGGTSNIGLTLLESALNDAFANVPDQIGYSVSLYMDHFCFVPTVSGFDLPVSTNLFNPTSGGVAARSSASQDNSVVSPYSQQPEFNQEHVTMNIRISDVLVDELMAHPTADALGATLTAGQIYNFGKSFDAATPGGILSTPREISQDLVVQSGAQLWINRKDRIAYTSDSGNPQNIRPQAFFVSVPGQPCEGGQKVKVTIEDGGKLVVGDNAVSPKNTGGLYFTSASELYAFGSEPIVLEDNSELTFDKDSRFELRAGALLRAKANVFVSAIESDFIMESGSKVLFESSGDFRLNNTSIDVSPGAEIALLEGSELTAVGPTSTIRIRPGATLRISGDGAAKIYPGATLILDPGAIVILESSESRILIKGTLVWNGDINFSGLGYFDFEYDHSLELGPNADAFRLTGTGKNNRFIRIGHGASLIIPNAKGLALKTGAVEHHGAEILLGTASWCDLEEVKVYGYGVSGLFGVQVGDVVIKDCTFDGLSNPILIYAASGVATTEVRNSNFSNYHTGAYFSKRSVVLFENCQFLGTPAFSHSGIVSGFNFITHVKGCTISDHDADVLDIGNAWADPLSAADAAMGIRIEGGWLLWMDGGEINNCEIGIGNQALHSQQGVPTNIYMNHFATIRGCHSGIVMNGEAVLGLVVMDCARILDIKNSGIYGQDITLVIDPFLLYTMTNGTNVIDPNVFTRSWVSGPPNKYINVCYVDKTPAEPLPAKSNFWGLTWGGATYADANPNVSISLNKSPLTGPSCSNPFIADVIPVLQDEPAGCARQFGPAEPDDCAVEVFSESPKTVRQEFLEGIERINGAGFEDAYSNFDNIAGLWQHVLTGFSNSCETLIDAAKSLSDGRSRSHALVQKSPAVAHLFPNPTSGEATLSLPAENCHIRIWDTFGKLLQENTASGRHRIDASTWPAGLYWIDIATSNGAWRKQLKMVVQR